MALALAHLRAARADGGVTPTLRRLAVGDVELAYFEWHGEGDGPTVLMVHATGFHARCWDGVIRALGGRRILALDMRGHGRSEKKPPYDWRQFGIDLAAFADVLGLEGAVGVGHSMGGHCVVQAAAAHPARFSRLVLVDPVILDPQSYGSLPSFASAEDHPVSKRRDRWPSAEAMIERFKDRHPFSLWDPAVLADYCRYGLNPAPDDAGFVLGCPPLVEAAIYLGSAGRDIAHLFAEVVQPTAVLRARRKAERDGAMDFSQSPTWEGLAAALPNGRDVYLPQLTHFIPMQRPDLVAAHVRAALVGADAVE